VYVAGNPQTFTPMALMYRLTRATGALTAIGDPVLLPIPMSAGNTAAYVMTAAVAGNFFYAGSYNDGLRSYAIDNDSGQLYELAVTNPLPLHDVRAIAAEPGGQYLFVAARDLSTGAARIQAYALGSDGGLTTVGAFADPPSLFLYWPLVVANTPPAGVTLDALAVLPADKQVSISAPTGTEQFSAIGHYSDGSTAFFTSSAAWSTSNAVVGRFDPLPFYNGKFTISGYGTTNVTATANGLTGTTTFSVGNAVLSLSNLHHVYDGSAKAAVVTGLPPAATGLQILYDGSAQPPTDAGSYTVVASINSPFYFAASVTGTLIIERANSETAVECSVGPFAYDGSPQTPCSATVTGVGLQQQLGIDYANNVDAGVAHASATFAGDANHLPSSGSTNFTIGRAASHTAVVFEPGPYTYRGTPFIATARVTGVGGLDDALAITYSGECSSVTLNGCTASAAYGGDANHESSTGTSSILIERAASTVVVSCPTIPSTYTGAPITPCTAQATAASMGAVDVTASLQYTNNTAAGTADAAASWPGDANHEGSSGSGTFVVGKAASHSVVVFEPGPYTYRGTPFIATARVTGAGGLDDALTVDYSGDCANVSVNGCTASATYAGDANHDGSSHTGTISIAKAASTTVVSCSAAPVTYTGVPHTPCSATVTGAGGLNQPLPVLYGNNTKAGIATASAAYVVGMNHTSSSDATTFMIGKANPTVNVAGYDVIFDGAAHTSTGTATGVLNETLSGLNLAGTTHTAVGVYADVWTFSDATGNYHTVTATVTNIIRGGLSLIGFHQPVAMGSLNTVKGGSTVPEVQHI